MPDSLSLLPAVVAIAVVIWRKEVILALILAVSCAEVLLYLKQPDLSLFGALLQGPVQSLERIISVTSSADNSRILLFSLLIGALMAYMRDSGGVSAMVNWFIRKGVARTKRQAGFISYGIGILVFIESNLSALTAGIVSRGLYDKFKMSRARLAYIVDSTSAPICILILLNGWGAYVLGLLSSYSLPESAISVLIGSIPLNFYALFTLITVFYTIYTDKVYGPMKQSEIELNSVSNQSDLEIAPTTSSLMLVPLLTLVLGMVAFMFWTGNGNLVDGSGAKAALYATTLACVVAYGLMIYSTKFNHQQLVIMGFKGMSELLPLVSIVLLSLALGSAMKDLGTGLYVASFVKESTPLVLIPALLFIAGAVISFTTGTSWGTFAILIPIGMPLVEMLGLPPSLLLAAILSGGIWGDHCSPISDTTVVSSVAAGCDVLEHVKTQLPYALFCGALALLAFLISGWLMIG
ncbi:sodium:proton antiporter [Rheinheimera sediminis]|uniref:Na+/H+ antiporter NhaC family protein n=1 Tax=Rheinheimera sp. YQF-1 TaxID=2499626 RepID=UPI000FD81435|nr:Na+/H+ antiporter NhaC family protein [Rheinheimera sp. YQF-1]RVT44874.1 sodium:proton antiporter [Rheinheimera sp. YQF-1]